MRCTVWACKSTVARITAARSVMLPSCESPTSSSISRPRPRACHVATVDCSEKRAGDSLRQLTPGRSGTVHCSAARSIDFERDTSAVHRRPTVNRQIMAAGSTNGQIRPLPPTDVDCGDPLRFLLQLPQVNLTSPLTTAHSTQVPGGIDMHARACPLPDQTLIVPRSPLSTIPLHRGRHPAIACGTNGCTLRVSRHMCSQAMSSSGKNTGCCFKPRMLCFIVSYRLRS
jgi:hypothetical protein